METERVADAHREQENETAQIPPRTSRENSLDRHLEDIALKETYNRRFRI